MQDKLLAETITVGKIESNVSLIYSIIFSIFYCVVGFFLYKQYRKNSSNNDNYIGVTAKIVSSDCKYYMSEKMGGKYSCNLEVSYDVDNKKYTNGIINNGDIQYKVGSEIDISYSKTDPNIIKIGKPFELATLYLIDYFVPGMFLTIGLIGVIGTLYRYYMVRNYNVYASTYATGAAFGHGFKTPM